jgi:hypothetical protein
VGGVGWRTPSAKRLACRLGCCQSSGEGPADGGREMTGSVSLTGPEIRSTVKLDGKVQAPAIGAPFDRGGT